MILIPNFPAVSYHTGLKHRVAYWSRDLHVLSPDLRDPGLFPAPGDSGREAGDGQRAGQGAAGKGFSLVGL